MAKDVIIALDFENKEKTIAFLDQFTGRKPFVKIGMGGVSTAKDVIEMMMAGAKAVQVGAANLVNPYACKEIIEQLPVEMEKLGIERLSDIQRV